jgi:hypothetical protein
LPALKVAETDLAASIFTMHGPVPVQPAATASAPLQPAKTPLPFVVAVSVTLLVLANAALHVLPQLIPAGLLVTVPRVGAVPLLVTLSVFLGTAAAIVNGNALDALDPEFIAETWAVPAVAISAAGIAAVTWVTLPKVVVRGTPFHSTEPPETKLLPLTVSVNACPPAVAVFGEREASAGGVAESGGGGGGGVGAVVLRRTRVPTDGTPVLFTAKSR